MKKPAPTPRKAQANAREQLLDQLEETREVLSTAIDSLDAAEPDPEQALQRLHELKDSIQTFHRLIERLFPN